MRKNNYKNRCLQHTTKGICFVFFNIFTIVTIYMVKKWEILFHKKVCIEKLFNMGNKKVRQ